MTKLLALVLLLSSFAFAQRAGLYTETLSAVGIGNGTINVGAAGVTSHQLTYSTTGTPASVSIQIEGSVDGTTYALCGLASTTITSNTINCVGTYAKIRANLTTFSGGTAPTITYSLSSLQSSVIDSNTAVSACNILSAASNNSTSCKAASGTLYGFDIHNTTTTVYYLRLYNIAAAPTCSSATGFIRTIPIQPASAAGGVGGEVNNLFFPVSFPLGIGYCITAGSSSTDNTSAVTGIFGEIRYK